MKITKRILAVMLGLTMITAIPQGVLASVINVTNADTVSNCEITQMPKFVRVWGNVEEKNDVPIQPVSCPDSPSGGNVEGKNDVQIHIKNSSNINNDIVLNISEETVIIDAVSGLPVSPNDIDLNESIYAYISPIMTLSLPPMSNAKAIIVNIPQDFKVPSYIEVQSVNKNDDGSITVMGDDEFLEMTLDSTTNIFPYLTKNIVTIDNIKVGSNLFLWNQVNNYEVQIPENELKVKAQKCLLMPYGYSALIKASVNNLNIEGNDINFTSNEAPFMQEKTLMVPLKLIAETCGYNVNYNDKTGVAIMTKEGAETYSVTINSDMVNVKSNNCYLGNKTMLKNNTVFVSTDLFNLAQNAKVVVEQLK